MLSGERVVLREVRTDDLLTLYDIFRDLDTWELRGPAAPGPMTWDGFREWYSYATKGLGKEVELVITVQDEVVGRCAMFNEDQLARHAEVGIDLVAPARGHGYGTDALRVLVDLAFTRRNLRRLHLEAVADNVGALACYRKVGFVEEGRQREHAWVRGHYVDMIAMGLLRSEWSAR